MKPVIKWTPHWTSDRHVHGYVKSIRMFEIESEWGAYALHCFLGSSRKLSTYFSCIEDAKKTAQRIFENFLKNIEYE